MIIPDPQSAPSVMFPGRPRLGNVTANFPGQCPDRDPKGEQCAYTKHHQGILHTFEVSQPRNSG